LVAFFAPCSFAILPGYITFYISKYTTEDKQRNLIKNIIQGFIFGLIASSGFFTIFGLAGFSVIAIGQFIKQFIPWIAIVTGLVLIIVGILMFFDREFLFFQAPKIRYIQKNEKSGKDIALCKESKCSYFDFCRNLYDLLSVFGCSMNSTNLNLMVKTKI